MDKLIKEVKSLEEDSWIIDGPRSRIDQVSGPVLKSDLMDKLTKVVKSLDDDSWMFDGPRSRINLISGPGGLRHRGTEIPTRRDMASPRK